MPKVSHRSADREIQFYLRNDQVQLVNPKDASMRPATAEARRQSGNKEAQHNGRWWEDRIKNDLATIQSDPTLRSQIAIIKTDPPTRTVIIKGRPTVIYEKEGPPDWMGVAFGVPVALETKHKEDGHTFGITMPTLKSKGNVHQYEFLCRFSAAAPAALVGYYIHWGQTSERRFHPLSTFSQTLKTKRVDGFLVSDLIDLLTRFAGR